MTNNNNNKLQTTFGLLELLSAAKNIFRKSGGEIVFNPSCASIYNLSMGQGVK